MESGQLRKLNLCYAGIQSLYWAGFAAIWAFLSVLLLYRGFSNSQIGTVSALALLMPLAVDRKERRVGKECRSRWSPYH